MMINLKIPKLADEALGVLSMVWVIGLACLSIHWAVAPASRITILQPGVTIHSSIRDVIIPSPYIGSNACVTLKLMTGNTVIKTYSLNNDNPLVIQLPADLPKGVYQVEGFIEYSNNPINKDSVTLNLAKVIYE